MKINTHVELTLFCNHVLYVVLGVVVALLSSMAGVGGGVFMVPLFYIVLSKPINVAIGTSKAIIVVISFMSAYTYLRRGRVDLRVGTILLSTTVPGSYIGAYIVGSVNGVLLEYLIAFFILYYSVRLILRSLKEMGEGDASLDTGRTGDCARLGDSKMLLTVIVGLLTGLIAGLTGTGGGALLVPFMLSLLNMGIHEAVATSMYSMTLAAVAAAIRHYTNGDIDFGTAIPFALGAVIGAQLGPRLALRMSAVHLRFVLGVVLIIVSLRMLFG